MNVMIKVKYPTISMIFLWIILFSVNAYAQSGKPASAFEVVSHDGAWCWFSDPRAVYHKGKKENIYFGSVNSKGDVVISARDLRSRAVESFVLHRQLQIDDHNVPSILVLPDGRIAAFYSEHNGKFFIRKSKYPEDISEWQEEKIVSFGLNIRLCYSNPVMLSGENNRIYLFYRGISQAGKLYDKWGQYFSYSDDGGDTWTDGKYYLDTRQLKNTVYLKITSDNRSRIDFVFTDGHPKIGPASVYHMYYEGGKFHQTNGDDIAGLQEVPLQLNRVNKVYDVGRTNVKSWIWDIALDKDKRPVIAYAQYPSVNEHIYHYARWNGKQWIDKEVVNSGKYITSPEKSGKVLEEHYSGGIVLDHNDPSNIYLSRQIDGVFEIEHRKLKRDGWKINPITSNSETSNIRPYVVAHNRRKKPAILWMNGVYNHYTRYKTALMINEPVK